MHRFGRWKFSLGFCPGKLMSYLFCDFIVDTITGVLLPTPPPPHPPLPSGPHHTVSPVSLGRVRVCFGYSLHFPHFSVLPRRKLKTAPTSPDNILRTKTRGVKFRGLLGGKYINSEFLKWCCSTTAHKDISCDPCGRNSHLYSLALKATRKRKLATYNSVSLF